MAAKLRVAFPERLGYVPPLIGYLANVDAHTDGYRYYNLRHPGGIFNVQLNDFTIDLFDLTLLASTTSPADPLAHNAEVSRKLKNTLFSFTSYYNAGYDIILGCCDRKEVKPSRDVWRWLKDNGYSAEAAYKSNLSEATDFANMFNELKHSSKGFGTVTLTTLRDNVQITGYYLEAIDDGPDQ